MEACFWGNRPVWFLSNYMKSIFIRLGAVLIFCLVVVSWYIIPDHFFVEYSDALIVAEREKQKDDDDIVQVEEKSAMKHEDEQKKKEPIESKESIKQSVPFTSQAPHAQWEDARFQDACEEASMIMAYAWITDNSSISKNDAEDEMTKLFSFEDEKLKGSIDTSADDTALVFQEYYDHPAEVHHDVTMEDIYNFLGQNAIVIVPTNGKMLSNPNFSNGGPDRHMLVIIGYDKKNKEFITNDPGTRLGRGYKYKDSTLYNAIRDYKTGTKEEISGGDKNVIVIKK